MNTHIGLTDYEKEAAAEEVEKNIKQRAAARERENEDWDEWYKEYLKREAEQE